MATTTLIPLNDVVIVELHEGKKITRGGIILTDQGAKEMIQTEATVLAVGPGAWLHSGTRATIDLKVGDRVILGRASCQPVEDAVGNNARAVRADEIISVVPPPGPNNLIVRVDADDQSAAKIRTG